MKEDYQALAVEAIELANSLFEENKRLQLSIALLRFKAKRKKGGRKQIFSDDDVLAMVEFLPKFKEMYKAKGKKLNQRDFVELIVRKQFPGKNQYALSGKIKTMQNRMNEIRKNPLIR